MAISRTAVLVAVLAFGAICVVHADKSHVEIKLAIPLSNVTIFGGSISNCFLNLQKRHPSANQPLIDFDLVNVMEPLTIAGAIIGSLLNKLLPGWLITLMLVVVLGLTGVKTFKS